MTDLSQLLEKVRTATGPDRAIDRDIAEHIVGTRFRSTKRGREWLEDSHGGVETWVRQATPYTTSLDAIVALIERELPGWWWKATKTGRADMELVGSMPFVSVGVNAKTPALALCAAFLSALISKEKADG